MEMQVIPKVKNFIWRACSNYLTTNWNLWRKKIKSSAICAICEKEDETVEHALLLCEWIVVVWHGLDIRYKVDIECDFPRQMV